MVPNVMGVLVGKMDSTLTEMMLVSEAPGKELKGTRTTWFVPAGTVTAR